MTTPQVAEMRAELVGERRRTNVMWSEEDQETVRELSEEANLTQGEILHIALTLVEFIALNERLTFGVLPDTPISTIELASIQIAFYSGLITDGERDLLLAYGHADPQNHVSHRLNVLFRKLSDRMAKRDADFPERLAEYRRVIAMTPAERLAYLEQEEQRQTPKGPVKYDQLRRGEMETRDNG